MDQKKKRLSILKKPARYESSSPTQTFSKSTRRISFSGTKSVKEFIAGEDKATIWGTSYEEEDGNHGSGVSSQENFSVEASAIVANTSIGMTLRNRKIIQPTIAIEEKENIPVEQTNDTMDTAVFATSDDYRTFNGTLDVTLMSFEIRKFVKKESDEQSRKQTKTVNIEPGLNAATTSEIDETSQNIYSSFIGEQDRKMLLQNRNKNKKDSAKNILENNEQSKFLDELDKLRFDLPETDTTRNVLGDKNLGNEMDFSLTTSPIKPLKESRTENQSNIRKTIVFQQGENIESIENENQFTMNKGGNIRKTEIFNEDLLFDASIAHKSETNNIKPMKSKQSIAIRNDEMIIEDVNRYSPVRNESSDTANKRKTIIFQKGEDIANLEIDRETLSTKLCTIPLNPPTRKTIIFTSDEKIQFCPDENQSNADKKAFPQTSRQALIFNNVEKINENVLSTCPTKLKCETELKGDMDMDLELNSPAKPAQNIVKNYKTPIENEHKIPSDAPSRKTIIFPKGENVATVSDQVMSERGASQQKIRQTMIFDNNEIIDEDFKNIHTLSSNTKRNTQFSGVVDMEIESEGNVIDTQKMDLITSSDTDFNGGDDHPATFSNVSNRIQLNAPNLTKRTFSSGFITDKKSTGHDQASLPKISRQTMVFDHGEKINDDFINEPSLPINTKRITQLFESLDMEVEEHSLVKATQDLLKDTMLRSFSSSESLADETINLSLFNKVPESNRKSLLLKNNNLEEPQTEPYYAMENTTNQHSIGNTDNHRDLSIQDANFEMKANEVVKTNVQNNKKENRDPVAFQRHHIKENDTKKNENMVFESQVHADNMMEIFTSANSRETESNNLSTRNVEARKTIQFSTGEMIEDFDEIFGFSAKTDLRAKKNEVRKTLIFQYGEPLEEEKENVHQNAEPCTRNLILNKGSETRKTEIFGEKEFLEISGCEKTLNNLELSIIKSQNLDVGCRNQESNKFQTQTFYNSFQKQTRSKLKEIEYQINSGESDEKRVPCGSSVLKKDIRKTKIFDNGEPIEDINVRDTQILTSDPKDTRKTMLLHKDVDVSGLAFLDPDNSLRPLSETKVPSNDIDMEIESFSILKQNSASEENTVPVRKTIIFSKLENPRNISYKQNSNTDISANDNLISHNVLPNQVHNQIGKLENKFSKNSLNIESTSQNDNFRAAARKTNVFPDEDMEIEPETDFEGEKFNQYTLCGNVSDKKMASHCDSAKYSFSRLLKQDKKSEESSNQSLFALSKTLEKQYVANSLQKMTQSNENLLGPQLDMKQQGNSLLVCDSQNKLKSLCIVKNEQTSIQGSDLSFDSSPLPEKPFQSSSKNSQRKTIVFLNGENLDLNESQRNKFVDDKRQNFQDKLLKNVGSFIPKEKRGIPKNNSPQNSQLHTNADISIDRILPIEDPTTKRKNQRKTMIFPEGEAIEEENDLVENNTFNHMQLIVNNTNNLSPQSGYRKSFPSAKDTESEKYEIQQNLSSRMKDREHTKPKETTTTEHRQCIRKSVIIENSPAKQFHLSEASPEHIGIKSNPHSNNSNPNILICHAVDNDEEMNLDEPVLYAEKESTRLFQNNGEHRRTIFFNEEIGTEIETNSALSFNDVAKASNKRVSKHSFGRNESSRNITQSMANNHSTFVIPHNLTTQSKQNESQDPKSKCSLTSLQKNRETFMIYNDANKNQNEISIIIPNAVQSSAKKVFENNSSTTSDIHPNLLRKFAQDSVYLSRTANFPMAGMESFQATSSSFSYSPNSTAALCNLDPNLITGAGYKNACNKNSASNNTFYKQFKRDYAEITIDAIRESPNSVCELDINESIEKIRIDLVDDTVQTIEDSPEKKEVCEASVMILNLTETKGMKADLKSMNTAQQRMLLCRKCKNCQKPILNETARGDETLDETTLTGFNVKEDSSDTELNFEGLDKLIGKPNFWDIWNEYQTQNALDCFNATPVNDESILFPEAPSTEFLLNNYEEEFLKSLNVVDPDNDLIGAVCPTIPGFFFLFQNRLREKGEWNFDDLSLINGIVECRNRNVRGIKILFEFDSEELYKPKASEIKFNKISLERCRIYKNPSPFDKAVQNEIFLKLPSDLTGLCYTSKDFNTFLADMHTIFIRSKELVKDLLKAAFSNYATFDCDESNYCIIRKRIFNDTLPAYGHRIEFRIRIRDIEKMCSKDILLPPQSFFKEDINKLPSGLEFIKCFLSNPVYYLK